MNQSSSVNFCTDPHPTAVQRQNRLGIVTVRNPSCYQDLKKNHSRRHLSQEINSDAQRQRLKTAPEKTVATGQISYRQKPSNIARPSAVVSKPCSILTLLFLQQSPQQEQTRRIRSRLPTTPNSLARLESNTPCAWHRKFIPRLDPLAKTQHTGAWRRRTVDPDASPQVTASRMERDSRSDHGNNTRYSTKKAQQLHAPNPLPPLGKSNYSLSPEPSRGSRLAPDTSTSLTFRSLSDHGSSRLSQSCFARLREPKAPTECASRRETSCECRRDFPSTRLPFFAKLTPPLPAGQTEFAPTVGKFHSIGFDSIPDFLFASPQPHASSESTMAMYSMYVAREPVAEI